jgi:hypothetical protein
MAEQSSEPEPPITRDLSSEFFGGGPVYRFVCKQPHNTSLELVSRMIRYRVQQSKLCTARFAALAPSRQRGRFGILLYQRLHCV